MEYLLCSLHTFESFYFTLVLSPSLEDEQRLSVGVLLTALKSEIYAVNSYKNI